MDELELRIEELMADSGLSRAEARELALREEAERAYRMSEAPAPQKISPQDLNLWPAITGPSARSAPRPSSGPPASNFASSRPGAAEPCRCGGTGYYVADVPLEDPQFGKLLPCSCTLRARAQRAGAAQASLLAHLHAELGRLRSCTLTNFDVQRPLGRAVDAGGTLWNEAAQRECLLDALGRAEGYADSPDGWLYIHGPIGSGKSHLAAAIANALTTRGHTSAYTTTAGLITFLKAGFADSSADRRLVALQNVELLVLDDLGTERAARVGEWAYEQFYELLNARYLHERPTILTSNLPPDHLEDRLRDRVAGMAVEIHLVASSYRQLKHLA